MLCRHPARVCPHAEADIAEAAGGVGTHPDGHTLAHLGTHPSPLIYRVGTDPAISTLMEPASGSCDFSRAAWGHTLVNS